jgi:hypothetical protein
MNIDNFSEKPPSIGEKCLAYFSPTSPIDLGGTSGLPELSQRLLRTCGFLKISSNNSSVQSCRNSLLPKPRMRFRSTFHLDKVLNSSQSVSSTAPMGLDGQQSCQRNVLFCEFGRLTQCGRGLAVRRNKNVASEPPAFTGKPYRDPPRDCSAAMCRNRETVTGVEDALCLLYRLSFWPA